MSTAVDNALHGTTLEHPTLQSLEFGRATGHRPLTAVAYRSVRAARRLLGERRTLALLLDIARVSHRLAQESSWRVFGDDFHFLAMALDEDVLRDAVPAGGTVLDVGCGTGRWCRRVAPYARAVVGIDHSAANIRIAREKTTATNVEYRLGPAIDVIGGDRFDVAILVHILEHIDNARDYLQQLHSVVDRLVIEVPDFEADPLAVARLSMGRDFATDADHVRELTATSLTTMLHQSGWCAGDLHKRGGAIAVVASPSTCRQPGPATPPQAGPVAGTRAGNH
jgi:SAM-dependent methyltransferase